jgi:hypothetical protein
MLVLLRGYNHAAELQSIAKSQPERSLSAVSS